MTSQNIDNNHTKQNKNFIERAFPIPRSLILANTAIDISDDRLKFYELSRNRGIVTTKSYGSIPFPHIDLGSPNEKSRAEAIAALKSWSTAQKCKSTRIIIHEDEVYVFKVSLPTTNNRELRSFVESVLEENVPIPPSDAIFEYEILSKNMATQTTVVAVSVISKKSAGSLIDLFLESDIQVVSIETEARALAKALFLKNDDRIHAVVSIMEHHSVICIVEKGAVVFSSAMEVGSADLDQAIAKEFAITEQAARELKQEKAFGEGNGDMKIFEAMVPIFSIIQDELNRMIVYWRTQAKKNKEDKDIENVVLVGSDALIAGFSRYISINSKLPTKIGSVWTNISPVENAVPEIFLQDSFEYGTTIGTLL